MTPFKDELWSTSCSRNRVITRARSSDAVMGARGDDHLERSGNRKGGRTEPEPERRMKTRAGEKSWLVISDVKGKKGQEREREIGGREEVS